MGGAWDIDGDGESIPFWLRERRDLSEPGDSDSMGGTLDIKWVLRGKYEEKGIGIGDRSGARGLIHCL